MNADTNARIIRHAACSDLARLASIALGLPNGELARGLSQGDLMQACEAGFSALGFSGGPVSGAGALLAGYRAGEAAAIRTELRQEFTRLFCVPRNELLYNVESRYGWARGGRKGDYLMFVNKTCVDVERMMRSSGFTLPNAAKIPADSIAVELEYLSVLYGTAAIALAGGADEKAAERVSQARDFRARHFDAWAGAFFADMRDLTDCAFYRAVAQLGLALLGDEGAA